jgi:hypothetical protein
MEREDREQKVGSLGGDWREEMSVRNYMSGLNGVSMSKYSTVATSHLFSFMCTSFEVKE